MRIVAIGGGTGLSTLLRGLKRYVDGDGSGDGAFSSADGKGDARPLSELTAIVTVTDDGGSSGRLRRDFRVLPPGDIRNCLVALSEDEALLSRLFQFRFAGGRGLKGHSFGNLFLTALTGVTGDFQEAVKLSGEVLAIRGRIFPSTMSDVRLEAETEDGRVVSGETKISGARGRIARIRLVPARSKPLPQTLAAIEQADAITVGPGSLFTSLIPNLLVQGVAKAMARSPAVKIYVCNLMTQPGETTGFTASEHLRAIYDHCGFPLFDAVLLNCAPIPPDIRRHYLMERSRPVETDLPELIEMGLRVVSADLVSDKAPGSAAAPWIRHDPDRLAGAVLRLAARHLRARASRPRRKTTRRRRVPPPRR